MQNIAIIRQGTGRYLFSLPDNVTLKEGDRVKCSTKRGITDGIAFADSAWVDENVSQLIGKLTGAKFPLKPVAGKMEYQPFENPADKPTANPANKYEGMSNNQLDREMCVKKGMCLATNSGSRRKRDCPFAGKCNSRLVTDADRAEVIKYLLSEDAEADPKPEDKPTEGKRQPIKLYCVKDYNPGEFLTKGKVYEIAHDGAKITYDDGWAASLIIASDNFRGEKIVPNYLVPLVKRPAKVGEWVYITKSCEERASKGKIYEVAPYGMDSCLFIKHPEGLRSTDGAANIWHSEYLVLDGYHAEAEPKPQENPTEDKQEPIKLYCVKDYGNYLNAGKIYELRDGYISVDGDSPMHGQNYKTLEGIYRIHPQLKSVLFPLVKRPAKVGEWVLLDRDDCFHINKQGDVVKVVDDPHDTNLPTHCFINDPTLEYSGGICVNFEINYSYVLDGYHPAPEAEPEPEPEYWSGKVVCVSSGDECFAVGKMYEFVNGKVKDDDGDERPMYTEQRFKSVDEWNSEYGMPIARFIEFKGEARD